MRQRLVPHDEIAGLAADGARAERVKVLLARIGAGGQAFEPGFAPALKAGHEGEGALLGRRVGEIKNSAGAQRDRRFDADVPMQVRTGEAIVVAFRRIEADPVGGGPQVRRAPELGEGLVDARRAAAKAGC
jgi:hypothetical protein